MAKGPTHNQIHLQPEKIERRPIDITRETLEPPSSRVYWIDCPFCGDEVKAYVWSLSGGGKRCDCGAMLSRHGYASHWKQE